MGQAIAALAFDPYPAQAFPWGTFQRLHVGRYRVVYTVEGDLIEINPLCATLVGLVRTLSGLIARAAHWLGSFSLAAPQ